jgi:hypothetical protein
MPCAALWLSTRARQLDEDLPRDVRERRAHATRGRELRDEDRRLAHDAVDEERGLHTFKVAGTAGAGERQKCRQ